MKKILVFLLAITMAFAFAACIGDTEPVDDANNNEQQEQNTQTPDALEQEDETPAPTDDEPTDDGGISDNATDVNNSAWDANIDEEFRAQLPKPEVSLFVNQITDGYKATFWGATEEYMLEYVEAVKAAGFTIDAATSSEDVTNAVVWYEAYNEAGYYVVINLGDNGGGAIDILKYE